jgi:leishmanolysin-like peptidase
VTTDSGLCVCVCWCDTGTTPRGYACTNAADPWNCAHFMSTPKVTQVARDFFNCPTLQGLELENQDAGCPIPGSHWEQRILQTEIMQPVVTTGKVHVSPMTLALFEDSGWYSADYSQAGRYAQGLVWGYKQGCAFATEKCLDDVTHASVGTPPHFVVAEGNTLVQGCSIDLYVVI